MDLRYEEYCFEDRDFYDVQAQSDQPHESFLTALPSTPPGWDSERRGVWQVFCPTDRTLPSQGWKIHVSAGLDNAERTLRTVYDYCVERDIPFKFLRSRKILLARNSKYAPRQASGKLMAIYPGDEQQLQTTLEDLSAALRDEPGPYILSDLRYGAGPLFLRYGAFLEQWLVGADGERVPAIERPDGVLVPDLRKPTFHLPDWASIPEFLAPHLAARRKAADADFPYHVESALHFSNGGGVYLASRVEDGMRVVLKEARPLAGLDVTGVDAVTRLDREWHTLRRLAGIPRIPEVYHRFTSWEHHFLAMRYQPGIPLGRWLAANYPLNRIEASTAEIADYTRRALHILDQVERILSAIHNRGMVFGDLHNRNLLIDEDDTVSLVDFELAFDVQDATRPALAAPGFAAPADRSGVGIDDYALAALRLWLFMPLTLMLTLDPGKVSSYLDLIRTRFPLPDEYYEVVLRELRPASTASPTHRGGRTELDRHEPDWPVVAKAIATAITASATPHRTDRLFPGDIETFAASGGAASVAWGAAGVLHTLRTCGFGRYSEYEQWLLDSVRRDPPARAGFYDGAHGIAYVLDSLGHAEAADGLLSRSASLVATLTGHALHGGLSGIGLNLLHFADRRADSTLRECAVEIGAHLADALPLDQPPQPGGRARAGLLHGWSGPALLFVRLFGATGDPAWLDQADAALRRDIAECVTRPDGSMQVRDGGRTLPYLEVGSAGIAVVARQLLDVRPDADCAQHLPALRSALYGEFVIQPGLLLGRAGLIAALASLRDPVAADPELDRALAQHLKHLAWHSVGYRDGIAFPGTQLLRLSMDLTTGSAGVLLAISAATDTPTGQEPAALPFLAPPRTPATVSTASPAG